MWIKWAVCVATVMLGFIAFSVWMCSAFMLQLWKTLERRGRAEAVSCRECVYAREAPGDGTVRCARYGAYMKDGDYCSYGQGHDKQMTGK